MKKTCIFIVELFLLIPLCVNAGNFEKFSYDKANIYFEIDEDVWHYKDFKENNGDVWTSDCGTITGDIEDLYNQATDDEKGGLSRDQYNYRNLYSSQEDAEYIANAWADNYKNKLGLDNVDWEIKDFGVKFIYFNGSIGSGETKVGFEQFFTVNNGYGIILQNMTTSDDKTNCSQTLEEIAKTAKVTDYASSELNPLGVIIDLILTIIGYMIYPFFRIIVMKHNYTDKKVKNMILWNSIIVGIIFTIITYSIYGSNTTTNVINFAPAFLYYYINLAIWGSRFKGKENSKDDKKNSSKSEEFIKCNKCGIVYSANVGECPKCSINTSNNELSDTKDKNKKVKEQFVCDNCGALVNSSAKVCNNCGESFEDDEKIEKQDMKDSSIDDKYNDLIKIKKLLDKNIITKEEFEREKKKILDRK